MKGVAGSNHDCPYFVSPASNLSAFAAPFSVNPYASTDVSSHFLGSASQFVDSTESAETVPPIHYQSYGYDFFPNPVRELDSAAQFSPLGFPSYAARSSLVQSQPYPVSSAIPDHASSVAPYHWSSGVPSSNWPSLEEANFLPDLGFSGINTVSWDQFPELNGSGKGKQVGVGSTSLSSKETIVSGLVVEEGMNQNKDIFLLNAGNQEVKESVNNEVSYIIDREKYNVPAISNHSPHTSSWWGTVIPMPLESSVASVLQSPSVSLETHREAPLKVVADSGNNNLSNIASHDKHSRHVDKSSNSSMPRTGLTKDMNTDDIMADQLVGHSNFFNTKEASYMPCPGTSGCYDPSHIRMHLGRNEPSSSNKAMVSDKNVSRNVDDYIFRGRNGYKSGHANIDNLSLSLRSIEDGNFAEKSFEGGDRSNPAEDSPCWKGASASHFSYFGPSAFLSQEYVHKKESSFGPVIQESQNYLVDTENSTKKSAEKSNGYQMQSEFSYQGTGSPRKISVQNCAYEDCKSGSALNGGPSQFKPNYDFGIQFLDIAKTMQNSVPPAKATNCESGSSHTEDEFAEKNKLMSQKLHTSLIGDAEAGCSVNKCPEHDSSYTAEHVVSLSSSVVNSTTTPSSVVNSSTTPSSVVYTTTTPSSVVDTTTMNINNGKVTTAKLNVQMIVDTMQNLSELLLYHCKNDVCELKERDYNVLKDVINNLNTCALKNAEQTAPAQECLLSQNQPETFNCAGDTLELHQNASFKRPQLTKIAPESSKVENPLVAEANLHFRSEKKLSDSISSRRTADMTKDLKRTLGENFHNDEGADPQTALYKNLWLEAEAELCSVYYKARYNQIKIEMDNHSYKEKEMESQSKSHVVPTLSQNQSTETKVHNYPNPGSSALKLSLLDASNLEGLSCLNFFTDVNKLSAMTPAGRDRQNLNSSIDSFIVSSSDEEPERNDETSVTARYHVLKARVDHSCTDTTNPEEPLDMADKSSPRGSDNQNAVNFCQDSPNPEKNITDYEASVVARFHILKSRHEGSSSISLEGKQLDGIGSDDKDMDDTTISKKIKGKSDVQENPAALVLLKSYVAMGESIPEEFHQDLEHSQEIQPCRTSEFQLSNYFSDGFSSDWEHVEKSL
ncbi:unnamed protein product [Sphenostylis stenocarpa]|uniref:Uncharacterized protein n=1 Tax=Sphenostylis stenocarpa TaxID=92480 RepID=A0AA86T0M6_9FABA|nr:unnamed protein product [Sphenostylis stenocarpa]